MISCRCNRYISTPWEKYLSLLLLDCTLCGHVRSWYEPSPVTANGVNALSHGYIASQVSYIAGLSLTLPFFPLCMALIKTRGLTFIMDAKDSEWQKVIIAIYMVSMCQMCCPISNVLNMPDLYMFWFFLQLTLIYRKHGLIQEVTSNLHR